MNIILIVALFALANAAWVLVYGIIAATILLIEDIELEVYCALNDLCPNTGLPLK